MKVLVVAIVVLVALGLAVEGRGFGIKSGFGIHNKIQGSRHVSMEFDEPITPPEDWSLVPEANIENERFVFHIAMKMSNPEQLEAIANAVSDPYNKEYGHHLTFEELSELVRPSKEVLTLVIDWLEENSAEDTQVLKRGDWIRFEASKNVAELLLKCKFALYEHTSGQRLIRTTQYFVPEYISEVIDFVSGTIRFPRVKTTRVTAKPTDMPDALVTPAYIKSHYNITATGSSSSNLQSVNQFLEQYYAESDLADFFKQFNLPQNKVAKVIGDNKPGNPGVEASLDIQYIMGVATDVPTWFIYTSGNNNGNQEPFIEWITALANTEGAPLVNSVSYGDVEASISDSYLTRTDQEFQAFGATGRSILFASGDSGVGCNNKCHFTPDWPASSPWVTTVGGTVMNGDREDAVSFSGGGFSNFFSRPSYQDEAVEDYLTNATLPNQSHFNGTSRGYPDIAAFATNFAVFVGGSETPVDGTSCAAPTASAIISLLNDARLLNGKSALGFLNPLLYSTLRYVPGGLYDITQGNNEAAACCGGFNAIKGWDPVTGLGSLNYGILRAAVLALP